MSVLGARTRRAFCASGSRRPDPRTGGITAVPRFGGALNLNVHFHTLIADGVFVAEGDGPARYFPVPQPRDEDVAAILARVVQRAAKVIVGFDEDLDSQADALAALQAAEVERRLRYPEPFEQARRGAFLAGFSLHAGIRIHANDGDGRERLCRYILRPPLALHLRSTPCPLSRPSGRLRCPRPRAALKPAASPPQVSLSALRVQSSAAPSRACRPRRRTVTAFRGSLRRGAPPDAGARRGRSHPWHTATTSTRRTMMPHRPR